MDYKIFPLSKNQGVLFTLSFQRFLEKRMRQMAYEIREVDSISDHKLKRIFNQELFKKKQSPLFRLLTRREKQILYLLSKGFGTKPIAERLFISTHTVEQHRKNIKGKLKVKSLPEIIEYALAFDLI